MAKISVETEIHEAMIRLTAAEKRAARALIANYPALGLAPVAEFAEAAETSPASVLRFIAQLGIESYPDFQRRLREELDERIKSPLQKAAAGKHQGSREDFLARYASQIASNLQETVSRLPASEFSSVCAQIANTRGALHLAGGRFTAPIADYMAAHLRIVRPGVRTLEARRASRSDELLDVRPGDAGVLFDIRRYDPEMLSLAQALKMRRARVILITDNWISPVSRYAKYVLPCSVDVEGAWDSSVSLFAIVEAIIARVTELNWTEAETRIAEKEILDGRLPGE